jgi:hypothetical protein
MITDMNKKNSKNPVLVWVCFICHNGVFEPAIQQNQLLIEICVGCGQRYISRGGEINVSNG